MQAVFLSQYHKENNNTIITVVERTTGDIYDIDIEKTILDSIINISEIRSIPKQIQEHGIRYLYDDKARNILIGIDDSYLCRPFKIDKSNDIAAYRLPFFNFSHLDSSLIHAVSQGISTYNQEKGVIATAYFKSPLIEFWNIDKDESYGVFYKEKIVPEVMENGEIPDYFLMISSTNKYIYALYAEEDKQSVMVLDWNQNPVALFHILPATTITVSPDDKKLYAYDFNALDSKMYVYDLPL